MRAFLQAGHFKGFTTTFEDLHGLKQLPGLAVQRLMAEGYGFGAEGDWKTAALVRAMKVMASGLRGGTSFMEDYTYHLDPSGMQVLGAHMLEVCPSIAAGKTVDARCIPWGSAARPIPRGWCSTPRPARLSTPRWWTWAIASVCWSTKWTSSRRTNPLPKLPVARVVWVPQPNLQVAAAAWIYSGGAHHTGFSQALTAEHLEDFAEIAGIEFVRIGKNTNIADLKKELRWNEVYYALYKGWNS